jgi:hypothetical protein
MNSKKSFLLAMLALFAITDLALAQDQQAQRRQSGTTVYGSGGGGQSSGTAERLQPATPFNGASAVVAYDDRTREAIVKNQDGSKSSVRLAHIIDTRAAVGRTLVIPKNSNDIKNVGEIEEDMNVMSHILEKTGSGDSDKVTRAMGIFVASKSPGSSMPQNLYIDGHGAIFFLSVNFPLLPPPAREVVKDEQDKPASNEWEQARREIEESSRPRAARNSTGGGVNPFGDAANLYAARAEAFANPVPDYDANKVEDLKKDIITALKNAAHIRRLKSDETITVVINGAGFRDTRFGGSENIPALGDLPEIGKLFRSDSNRAEKSSPAAKLLIRVRKSDAEAFQKNNLSFEEFRKKVDVMLFPQKGPGDVPSPKEEAF